MQTKEKCWMEGTQTKVTREKKKSFSKPLYIFTPSLSFSTCLYLCPLMATLPVFQLLLFPNKDGCLPLRHRGNTFRATCLCAIHSRPWDFSSLSFPYYLLFFFSSAAIRSDTPSISHQFHPKKSNTKAHILTHTYATHTGLLSAILLQIVMCEGSGCAHAPCVPVGKVAIPTKQVTNSFIPMLPLL